MLSSRSLSGCWDNFPVSLSLGNACELDVGPVSERFPGLHLLTPLQPFLSGSHIFMFSNWTLLLRFSLWRPVVSCLSVQRCFRVGKRSSLRSLPRFFLYPFLFWYLSSCWRLSPHPCSPWLLSIPLRRMGRLMGRSPPRGCACCGLTGAETQPLCPSRPTAASLLPSVLEAR